MSPSTSLVNKENLKPFAKAASLEVKALMARTETRYDLLSQRLAVKGVELSPSNLRNKVSGNALSAGLFLMIVSILSDDKTITVSVGN